MSNSVGTMVHGCVEGSGFHPADCIPELMRQLRSKRFANDVTAKPAEERSQSLNSDMLKFRYLTCQFF